MSDCVRVPKLTTRLPTRSGVFLCDFDLEDERSDGRLYADGNGSAGVANNRSTEDRSDSKRPVHGSGPGVDRVDLNDPRSPRTHEQQERHDQEGL